MAASPALSAYTDVQELEDAIARLDDAAEGLWILRHRARTIEDVAEAHRCLEHVIATLELLREWRNRKG